MVQVAGRAVDWMDGNWKHVIKQSKRCNFWMQMAARHLPLPCQPTTEPEAINSSQSLNPRRVRAPLLVRPTAESEWEGNTLLNSNVHTSCPRERACWPSHLKCSATAVSLRSASAALRQSQKHDLAVQGIRTVFPLRHCATSISLHTSFLERSCSPLQSPQARE